MANFPKKMYNIFSFKFLDASPSISVRILGEVLKISLSEIETEAAEVTR